VIGKRQLGASGVAVSEVGFGAWTLGLDWWGKVDAAEATRLVEAALECGITFFDTADTYGAGVGEERLGAALRDAIGKGRAEVQIGTKFGYDITVPHDASNHTERPTRWDPPFIRERCEESLRRLEIEAIDLYELHNPRMDQIRDDDIFAVLEDLKAEGKIRSYGVALGPAIGWQEEGLVAIADRKIDVVQTVFNMLEQEPGNSFIDATLTEPAAGVAPGIIARVPHASDALTGTYTADTIFPATDHRSFRKREWLLRALKKVDRLTFLLDSRTIGQAAIAWLLANPGLTTVLPTMTTVEQVKEFSAAALNPLTAEEFEQVQDLYRKDFDLPAASAEEQIELRTSS
jgi:aryl-alcohol dehydrogenase-like predicted oxidoreductase